MWGTYRQGISSMATCFLLPKYTKIMARNTIGVVRCQTCGAEITLTTRNPKQRYCSRSCAGTRPESRVTKPCRECGTPFTSDQCKGRLFCSKTCSMKNRWKDTTMRSRYQESMACKSEAQIRTA